MLIRSIDEFVSPDGDINVNPMPLIKSIIRQCAAIHAMNMRERVMTNSNLSGDNQYFVHENGIIELCHGYYDVSIFLNKDDLREIVDAADLYLL